ncbi:hypothetical protein BBBOND_0401020 [Babesia bigemina]|uniref:Uncharacterized protein n=1 Tax=Babesia bigemina TaxID=5866 RepID=A0A061DEN9_BABBI|nr:hypothetical protein BBBOND_0401020 [Babesia bigemina]CDR97610.1 hypothetical protein BBBOND_0401020 [Babesia bigemina]|eukprot:XP_012769796.1 hypothetical protein BBBOND_0401020 [Babesia bigemina]
MDILSQPIRNTPEHQCSCAAGRASRKTRDASTSEHTTGTLTYPQLKLDNEICRCVTYTFGVSR